MSALSFKITTDTAKINNFRKSLERLYELLEKFPSKSSGFKVINCQDAATSCGVGG